MKHSAKDMGGRSAAAIRYKIVTEMEFAEIRMSGLLW
jgi:hypothetical protein